MSATIQRKCGKNRGQTRLWLEGSCLSDAGWLKGDQFDVEWDGVGRCLTYRKCEGGARRVAGAPGRPIIDTNSKRIGEVLGVVPGDVFTVVVDWDRIVVFAPKGGQS